MGKRKSRSRISADILEKNSRSAISETLISCKGRRGEEDNGTVPKEGKSGFFACYLLTSLSPRHKGRTYIGFTVNPRRRIRQHNGQIGSGASRTKSARPWEMVFCIYGFPTHVSALQFEWAWQHPRESLAVRDASATFKSLTGLANKIKLGYTMLTLPAWENLNLTVNFFSTKYTKHYAGCPSLPKQMSVQVCSMDELPCYAGTGPSNIYEDEDRCEDDEKCENMNNVYASLREESTAADNWRINEETCNHNGEGIEKDIVTRQSGDFLSSTGEDTQYALFTAAFPLEESPTVTTNTCSALGGSKNNEVVAPIEENNGVEFDQPLSAVGYNEPSILTKVFPGEVEVIDLLSPSPDVRIRFRFSSKTRKSSDVAPETIDLTKSPIYV